MRKTNKLAGTYFCGNKASDYAIEQGYLDYATLAKAFNAVLNNDIMYKTMEIGYWEQENGFIDNSEEIGELIEREEELGSILSDMINEDKEDTEEYQKIEEEYNNVVEKIEELQEEEENQQEIFQYFIVSDNGAEIIKQYTNDPLFYNEELDMYVWGITHYGTAWMYVLTDIKLNCGKNKEN